MKRIVLTLLLLWPLVGAPPPALAQSPELMAAHNRYNTLLAQGKYTEAEPFARNALELGKAEFGPDHKNYSILLNNLALLYIAQGHYAEAEPLHMRALGIRAARAARQPVGRPR